MVHQGILVFDDLSCESGSPVLRVAGLSLLERGIRTMARTGIRRLLVVVPEGTPVQLSRFTQSLDVDLEFTHWGTSSPPPFALSEVFLLLLGDHVHHHSSLSSLLKTGLGECDCVVQTGPISSSDRAAHYISNASETATFTREAAPESRASSGAFLCAANLFATGELMAKEGDLWTFLAERLRGRRAGVSKTSPELWRWVTDRRSARDAKNMLFAQVTKSTGGWVARTINVRISVPLSKLLIETDITPNMVTIFLVLTTGLFSAYLISRPDTHLRIFFAGLFWQLASVLDGCDGEIARVKLGETKFGAWFDTVTDNLSYVCGYAAMLLGIYRLHPDDLFPIYAGLSAIAALLLTLALLYAYAAKTGTGSLQYYLGDLERKVPDSDKSWDYRLIERFGFVTKRSFLSLAIAIGLMANHFEAVYWGLVVLLHLAALGVLTTHYRLLGEKRAAPEPRRLPLASELLQSSSLPREERA